MTPNKEFGREGEVAPKSGMLQDFGRRGVGKEVLSGRVPSTRPDFHLRQTRSSGVTYLLPVRLSGN